MELSSRSAAVSDLPPHLILLDSRRAAAILGCSERTLERRRVEGNGPRLPQDWRPRPLLARRHQQLRRGRRPRLDERGGVAAPDMETPAAGQGARGFRNVSS